MVMLVRRARALAAAVAVAMPLPALAQASPGATGYQSMPEDERWDDRSKEKAGVSAGLKDVAVGPGLALDLGGSVKERGEAFDQPFFGLAAFGGEKDAYLLHRVLVHANLRVGAHLRVFVEGEDARQIGRSPRAIATDVDRGDVSQAMDAKTVGACLQDATCRIPFKAVGSAPIRSKDGR